MISGDRGDQGVGPSLPIHPFGNVASKNRRTCEPQCGGAPSCWKIIYGWNSSEVQRKVLVINVCNQGKTSCALCTSVYTHTQTDKNLAEKITAYATNLNPGQCYDDSALMPCNTRKTMYVYLISNFRRVLSILCFLLGSSPASELYMSTFRNTICSISIDRWNR